MMGGIWLRQPVLVVCYWGVVLLIVCLIGLLVIADWWAIRRYYAGMSGQHNAEHKALREELKRLQAHQGNGKNVSPPDSQ